MAIVGDDEFRYTCTRSRVSDPGLGRNDFSKVQRRRRAAMKIDGACHCGYITIEGEADPQKTTICHCRDCQTGTGSAFRVSVPVAGATFRMSGEPTTYLKTTAESGNPRASASCASATSSCRGGRTGSARRSPG